jgi:hypothetical protein
LKFERAVNGIRFARVTLACRDIFEKSLGAGRGDVVASELMRMIDNERAISTTRDEVAQTPRLQEWADLGLTSYEQAVLLIDDQVTRCKRAIVSSSSSEEALKLADLVGSLEQTIDYAVTHLRPRVKPRNGARGSTIADLMANRLKGDIG